LLEPDPRVDEHQHHLERRALLEVGGRELRPLLDRALARQREAVARHVDQVEAVRVAAPANVEPAELRRAARLVRDAREAARARQHVEQRRLSHVGTADHRHLGQVLGRDGRLGARGGHKARTHGVRGPKVPHAPAAMRLAFSATRSARGAAPLVVHRLGLGDQLTVHRDSLEPLPEGGW